MPRYFVFLSAINVGGRRLKMDQLRDLFVSMGYPGAETFIASGNVIIEADEHDPATVEALIEEQLQASLGYEVSAILRTRDELVAIAAHSPFPEDLVAEYSKYYYVWLLKSEPSPELADIAAECETEDDFFHVHGREVYFLSRVGAGRTTAPLNRLGRAFGSPATQRSLNTIDRLLKKYPE
jgi:uncharacterized protein (DUF1697 family)